MIISKKRLSPLNKFICILLTVCTHLFLLTLQINAPAQESKGLPFITNYHYRDYNADGINWWATEDDNGIMYFANNAGVLIFDGQQWELLKVPGIQETRSLVKGTDRKIYVGTNGDLGYLAPGNKGKYEFISLKNKLAEQHRLFSQIWETHVFKGNVYFRSSNKIFIWDYKSFRVLESKEGFHVGGEVNNEYYCRIWTRGLCVLKNDSFHVVPNGEKFANERIYVMLPYDEKRILIGSRTQGLFIYDGNDFIPFKTEADPYIFNTSLYGGRVLSNGLFALNTFNDGLMIIDKQGKLIQRIDKSVGLQDNSVDHVFEDSRGILWMALFNGIAKFDLKSSLTYYSESLGLPARTVFNVGSDNNKIYAGTNNGLYMLNSSTNHFEKVPGTSGQIGNFMRNGKDFLVAGAEKGLLKIIDGKVIPVIPGVNYDFHVSQILRSKIDTTIIYCDLRNGLAMVRYNPGTGKYSIEAFREGLTSAIGLFNETKQGNLWIAGDIPGELKLVKPEKKDGKLFLTEKSVEVYSHKQGLPSRGLIITEYDDKTYFIAQKDSIFLFDETQNRFIQDTSIFLKNYAVDNADGTALNPRDHLGRTWANFGTGVFVKIPTADGSLKIIDAPFRELGKNYPVWNITTTVDKEGKDVVWFSGREGIIRYDGSLDETTGGSFNTIIRGITLNEDSVYYSGFSIPLDNNSFSNKWNTIRFQYSAPFYKKENETLFSTLLEGKDKNWSDWTKQNFREFGNLPAGKYIFKVKSRNIYDVESSIATFPFTVLPPWYATWWAYLLYALAAIALIYGLIRWRTHQLHEKHRALEKTVKERTSQLSHRVEELAVINSVQEGLVREMNMQGIYELVGEKIRQIFNAQVIDIVTYDSRTNLMEDRYAYEKGDRTLVGHWEPKGFRKHVIESGQLLLINENLSQKSIEFNSQVIRGEQPKSALFVPMIAGNEVKGMISLQDLDKEHAFKDTDVRLLTTLANSMSVALESARRFDETNRLLKETEQRNAELAVINSVQESLVAKMDMNGIYELVGEKIREIFDAQVIDIVTYDKNTTQIEDRYAYEKGDRTMLGPRQAKGFRKHVIESRQLLLHNEDVEQKMKEFDNEILIGEMPKSQMYVPMIAGNEVKGIISLQNLDHEHAFSNSDVSLLTTLANSMSVALESARLFDETNRLLKETEQRTAELSVINSVQEGLARELDIQGVYELVGEKIREIFNAQVIDIVTYDKATDQVEDRYTFEKGDRSLMGPRPLKGFRKHVIQTSRPLVINKGVDQQRSKYDQTILTGEGAKSIVLVPMIAGGEATGVISLQNLDQENAFPDSDVNLLTTLANSMSVALENARLFDETNRLLKETEQRTAELAVINSVQDGLAKELDMQGIYNLVGDRVQKLFSAQAVIIGSFDLENKIEHFNYLVENGEIVKADSRPINKLRQLLIDKKKSIYITTEKQAREEYGLSAIAGTQMSKSLLFVPLLTGNIVKGYVSLQNVDRENAFSEPDVRLLETLANSMSVALENARLFDETNRLLKETEQRTAELAVINSVQEGLAKELDIQGIYDLVGERIRNLFDAQVVVIRTFDHVAENEHLRYAIEKGERIYVEPRPYMWANKQLIKTKESLLINENYLETSIQHGGSGIPVKGLTPKSALFVPMMLGDVVKGSISLQNVDRENAFTESDLRLLTTLSNSMSVALENARLFDETTRLLKETEQRTAELAVINSVQEGLAKELDIQGIYNLVGDRLCDLFPDTQTLVIRTFDHETGLEQFQYAIEKGVRLEVEPRPFMWANQQLIRTKKPVDIKENYVETAHKFGSTGVTKGQPPKSAVFVPMMVGDVVKGSISLQNVDRENAFSESDLRLLTTLTNSMSVALENARLFDETSRLLKETEQRTAELAVINSVQEGLARELDIKGIYELVGDRLCNLFPDTQTLVIRTFDHERGLELWQYAKEKGLRQYVEPRPFNWNSKQLINTKKPLDIPENYVETAKKYGGTGVTSGQPPKSALFVPMLVGDLVKGSVSLQNVDKEHAFTDSDLRLLTTITNSMSVALENARLFDETNRLLKETEQRTAELAVINSVQEGLVREMNMQAIYDLVGNRICELFDTQTVLIRTFDHRTGMENWQYVIEKGQRLYSNPRPFIWANKQLIQTKQPLLINENYIETAQKYGGSGVSKGLPPKSALFVPMIVGDVVRGSVSLQNVEKEHAFTESDLRLLTTLTNSMSVALENARLFDETNRLLGEAKQRANELSTVNNISQALASQLNLDDLIKLVGDEMRQLFRANIVYLAMLDKKTNIITFPYQFGDDLPPMKLGEGLTSKVLLTGQPLLINKDVSELTDKLGVQRLGIPAASYLGVPIPVGDEVIGVISVQSTEHENRFNENDSRLLTTIASSLGVALRKAKLFEEVHFAKMEAETARKTAEQANAAKSAFLSTVSHELRTPLTSVLGFAKIIKKRLEDKIFPITSGADPKTGKTIQQISENLKVVISEGERLTNLINEVLDLAKIEAGKMEWNMESISMEEIAERAIAATSSLFENKNLKLRKFIDPDLPVISGDKDKLIQVIVNLISNAVKFTPEGTVTCRVTQKGDEIVVGISDTGIGIAPEDHEAVFEQFKQVVGDTLTDKPKGTGLGLPICKEIVEHHGGRIWLESELGKGSTFFFALAVQHSDSSKPIHLKDLVRQLKEQMAHSKLNIKGKNATILVVDDDDSIRSLLQQELSDAGYIIEEATNGKEALESIRKHRPDLIILDIMMPEINGFDVAAILKNDPQTMDIPIIVLSIVQDKARGYRIGVDRYLTKPIDTAQLFAEVGALLEQGKSKKKVMVVDEDSTSVKSLTEVLQAKGYQVVESDGKELIENAIKTQPDIIILNSVLSDKEIVQSLRFEKGLENVLFLIYNNQEFVTQIK